MPIIRSIITNIRPLTPSIFAITVVRDDGQAYPEFRAGQYASVACLQYRRLRGGRPFSMVSPATDRRTLEFGIKRFGRFTSDMANVNVGDEATVTGPFGSFTVEPANHGPLVFLAGGIGITPFMSLIATATAERWPNPVTLIYSTRTLAETPYLAELRAYAQQNPNFRFVVAISDERLTRTEPGIVAGRITPELITATVAGEVWKPAYLLCGPAPFMSALTETLQLMGVPPQAILTERFSVSSTSLIERGSPIPRLVMAGWAAAAAIIVGVVYTQEHAKRSPPVTTTTVVNVPVDQAATNTNASTAVSPAPTNTATPTPTVSAPAPSPSVAVPTFTPRTTVS